jgi:hypothetical protein
MTDMTNTISKHKVISSTGTGIREIADINDIDTALAKLIATSFDNVSVPDTRTVTKGLRAFLRKGHSKRITSGTYDSLEEYLQAVQASTAQLSGSQTDGNRLALPMLNIGREMDYSFYSGDYSKPESDVGNIRDSADAIIAILRSTPVQLNYKLWLVADERQELGLLSSILGDWLRFRADLSSIDFFAASRLAGADVEMRCHIDGARNIMFGNIGLPEKKVYALELELSVIAELLVADFASVSTHSISVQSGVMYGNND